MTHEVMRLVMDMHLKGIIPSIVKVSLTDFILAYSGIVLQSILEISM
jgi:hypothetical protein